MAIKLKRVRRKPSFKIKFLSKTLFFCFIAIFFILFYLFSIFNNSDLQRHKFVVYKPYFSAGISKQILYNTFVTPAPKQDQAVLSGFCLHVPVLMYHHIQPESVAKELGQTALTVDSSIFDSQMAYLAQNGYTPIWANDLAQALISHSQIAGKPIVITMDDGYQDNIIYALPVLQKYGLKANIMLSTGLMGNKDMLSWNDVMQLKNSGLIYFTNHTWSHYAINKGPQEKIEQEIDTASTQIQQYTGQIVNMFTYPYGAFNDNAQATLSRKGYLGALTEIPGQTQCDSFLMTLHRTRIGNGPLSSYGL